MLISMCIRQAYGKSSEMSNELLLALMWWRSVLSQGISERRDWREKDGEAAQPLQMYCDARSKPPRLAAVLFVYDARNEMQHAAHIAPSCTGQVK